MQIHELQPQSNFKDKKRVGRGGKRGTYSGKGQNGQKCRSGANFQPLVREWLKKYPKLRGYKFSIREQKPLVINLDFIEKNFEADSIVSLETLKEKKLIRKSINKVKLLSDGELTKKVNIEGILVSKKAKEIIEKNKGEVK